MKRDFLDEVMVQFLAASPALPAEAAAQLEQHIRQVWGGERVYIGKRPAEEKVSRLAIELQRGVAIIDAFANAGLARRTGFRLLNRRRRTA